MLVSSRHRFFVLLELIVFALRVKERPNRGEGVKDALPFVLSPFILTARLFTGPND